MIISVFQFDGLILKPLGAFVNDLPLLPHAQLLQIMKAKSKLLIKMACKESRGLHMQLALLQIALLQIRLAIFIAAGGTLVFQVIADPRQA